jgi:phosphopantothenoylcysteine decarboxylase / phosphopantothenate---cysteine ligase
MNPLDGKRIVLGLTGGIACYKSAELLRRLMDLGATVDVVMTTSASEFITPLTFQALSGRPVFTDLWDNRPDNNMAHINLTRSADLIVVAPATANFMTKLAHGSADDLLSTLCLARAIPLMIAPAMNKEMWQARPTQRNAHQLRDDGVILVGPASGIQACGETGDGRMVEPNDLLAAIISHFEPKIMAGLNVLITAGPTCEPIDPVRVLTNRSSGKTGYAIAQAAAQAGARVTLVSGPTRLPCPVGVTRIDVQTAIQMHERVMSVVAGQDIFIAVAAVADWRIENASTEKLKKNDGLSPPDLSFVLNPDILADVVALPNAPWCVGFAAETTLNPDEVERKRQRKGVPLLIGNLAQEVMDVDHTTVELYSASGRQALERGSKQWVARQIVVEIARRFAQQ